MRYSHQIIFEKIGEEGQKKLRKSSITILGLGGIGSRSAELAARAGIGKLNLIDRDIVEKSNLQRQTLYSEEDINKPKSLVIKEKLEKINSEIKISAKFKDINYKNIKDNIKGNLVLDCTDNMETRFLLNEFCIENNITWIYSAVIGSAGMVFNIIPKKTPCFNCLFSEPEERLETCETEGIINTIPTLISSIQVTEALKFLTKQSLTKELIYYDLWKQKLEKTKIKKNPNCITCNKKQFSYLTGEKSSELIKFCGLNKFQLYAPQLDLEKVAEKLKKIDNVIINDYCLIFKELMIFKDGRVIIKADSESKAKTIYSKYIGN